MTANTMQAELCVPLTADFPAQTAAFLDDCFDNARAAVPPKQASRLRIAADEVASNLLSYSGAVNVTCRFAVQGDAATLIFCDDGTPYDPLAQAAPDTTAPAEDRAPGGLGLLLVRRLTDDVRYEYRNAQNVLTITAKLCRT